MHFDKVLKAVGEFGPYQFWMYILICLPCLFVGMHDVNPPFLLYVPKHRCKLSGYHNDTYDIQNPYHAELINQTIPPAADEDYTYDQCHIYVQDILGNKTVTRCSEWIYDKSVFTATFVTEQNMVCGDNVFQVANLRMMGFLGKTVGGIGVGILSDRKTIFCMSIITMLGTTLGLSWAPNNTVFSVLKFLYGISGIGVYSTATVLGMELVGKSKRVFAAIGVAIAYSIGIMILPGIGYWLRKWNSIEIAQSAPVALFLFYWIILPESPRWLISKGRKSEAKEIILKIAASNKTKNMMPPSYAFEHVDAESSQDTNKLWDLFKSPVLIRRAIAVCFKRFVINMAYYGLSLNVDNLIGDFYLNFFLTSMVDIPAYTFSLFMLDRIGRKKFFIAAVITGGVALLSTVITTLYANDSVQSLTLIMSMIGRLGVAAGFGVIYVWSAEIFPTAVRHSVIATSAVCGNIGIIISPYVVELNMVVEGTTGKVMPLMLLGVATLLSALMSIFLPETHQNDLPETMEQAENLGRLTVSRNVENVFTINVENAYANNVENMCTKL